MGVIWLSEKLYQTKKKVFFWLGGLLSIRIYTLYVCKSGMDIRMFEVDFVWTKTELEKY